MTDTTAFNRYEDHLHREYACGALSYDDYFEKLYDLYNEVACSGEIIKLDQYGYDVKSQVNKEINSHE